MTVMVDRPESVGDALPREMARVRDEVLPTYLAFPEGAIAAMLMREALDRAAMASAEGDVVAMIMALQDLRGFAQ